MFNGHKCNLLLCVLGYIYVSRKEDSLEGYAENIETKKLTHLKTPPYKWEYGNKSSKVVSYNIKSTNEIKVSSSSKTTGFAFRTPESFLNNLNKSKQNTFLDIY